MLHSFTSTEAHRLTWIDQGDSFTVAEMTHISGSVCFGLFKSLEGLEYSQGLMEGLDLGLSSRPLKADDFEFLPVPRGQHFNFLPQDLDRFEDSAIKSLAIIQANLIAVLEQDEAKALAVLFNRVWRTYGPDDEAFILDDIEVSILHESNLSLVQVHDREHGVGYGIFERLDGVHQSDEYAKAIGKEIMDSQDQDRQFDLLHLLDPALDQPCKMVRALSLSQYKFIATLDQDEVDTLLCFLDRISNP